MTEAGSHLTSQDLSVIDGDDEPRVRDIRLAEVLGFDRPRKIRELIERHMAELKTFGPSPQVGAMVSLGSGAQREVKEYWLNEAQALLVCTRAETPAAQGVRRQLITIFIAWRHGKLTPSPPMSQADLVEAIGRMTREIFAPLAIRFDGHDKAIEGVTSEVKVMHIKLTEQSRQIGVIQQTLSTKRKKVNDTTKQDHIYAVCELGGRCPCCGQNEIVSSDRQMYRGLAEFDHFYQTSRADLMHTWLICTKCHQALTTGRVSRQERETQFKDYHEKRLRLPGRQSKLL
jgi:hypothetical protein